jgi:hypothetical protein
VIVAPSHGGADRDVREGTGAFDEGVERVVITAWVVVEQEQPAHFAALARPDGVVVRAPSPTFSC